MPSMDVRELHRANGIPAFAQSPLKPKSPSGPVTRLFTCAQCGASCWMPGRPLRPGPVVVICAHCAADRRGYGDELIGHRPDRIELPTVTDDGVATDADGSARALAFLLFGVFCWLVGLLMGIGMRWAASAVAGWWS